MLHPYVLRYWYNDCGGADTSCIIRNFINACGFVCYSSGAMVVALEYSLPRQLQFLQWFAIIGAIVSSTVQMQDLYDQPGDQLRGRKTLPLVAGDTVARWLTVLPMGLWCIVCPLYWDIPYGISVPFGMLGVLVIFRCLTKRSVSDDRTTFRLWNLWVVFVYLLRLFSLGFSG